MALSGWQAPQIRYFPRDVTSVLRRQHDTGRDRRNRQPSDSPSGGRYGPRMSDAPSPPVAVLEVALYAEDLDAAERFYGELLGLEQIVRVPGRHVFFRAGSTVLLIFNPARTEKTDPSARLPVPPHGARGPGHLCFPACLDEIERWRRKLAAAGVEIEADFIWPNGARSIYFRDPAGNSIEMAEPRLWS